jgi:hypothetical protein
LAKILLQGTRLFRDEHDFFLYGLIRVSQQHKSPILRGLWFVIPPPGLLLKHNQPRGSGLL